MKSWCVHSVHRPKFKQTKKTKKTKQLNLKVGKRQTLHPRALEGVKAAQQKGFRSICRWRNAQAARMRQCSTVTRPSEMKTPRAPHSGRTQSGGRCPTRLKADSLRRSQPHSSGRTPKNGNLYSHKPSPKCEQLLWSQLLPAGKGPSVPPGRMKLWFSLEKEHCLAMERSRMLRCDNLSASQSSSRR